MGTGSDMIEAYARAALRRTAAMRRGIYAGDCRLQRFVKISSFNNCSQLSAECVDENKYEDKKMN